MITTKRISGRTAERAVAAVALATTMYGAGSALTKVSALRSKLEGTQTEARRLQQENRKANEALDQVHDGLRRWHGAMMKNATDFNEMLQHNPNPAFLAAQGRAHDLMNQSTETLATVRNALEHARGSNHPSVRSLGNDIEESWRKGGQMYQTARRAQQQMAPGRRGRGHR